MKDFRRTKDSSEKLGHTGANPSRSTTCEPNVCAIDLLHISIAWFNSAYWYAGTYLDIGIDQVDDQLEVCFRIGSEGSHASYMTEDPGLQEDASASQYTTRDHWLAHDSFVSSELSLADRYFGYRVRNISADPWSAMNHHLSSDCQVVCTVLEGSHAHRQLSPAQALARVLSASLDLRVGIDVESMIRRRVLLPSRRGAVYSGTANPLCLLPTPEGKWLRSQLIQLETAWVPAGIFREIAYLLPEHASRLVPVIGQKKITGLDPLQELSVRKFKFTGLALLLKYPLSSLRVYSSYVFNSSVNRLRRVHSRLLALSIYRSLWFERLRSPVKTFMKSSRTRYKLGNHWLRQDPQIELLILGLQQTARAGLESS